jgi:hypothetical protein
MDYSLNWAGKTQNKNNPLKYSTTESDDELSLGGYQLK